MVESRRDERSEERQGEPRRLFLFPALVCAQLCGTKPIHVTTYGYRDDDVAGQAAVSCARCGHFYTLSPEGSKACTCTTTLAPCPTHPVRR